MLCGRFLFFLIAFLLNTQALFAQLSEQDLQRMAQDIENIVENMEEHPDLLTDIQDIFREHSGFFNTIAQMQTNPEFEPYIEKYKALKAQYTGSQSIVNTKIFLSASPLDFVGRQTRALQGSGVCFGPQNWIVIDRGFWEYYQGNDEMREAVLIHELGHCDLNQDHGSNDIMNVVFEEDLLNGRTIDWDPMYREFFSMQNTRQKFILCSEDNSHLYSSCAKIEIEKRNEGIIICDGRDDELCYQWKDDLLNGMNSGILQLKGLNGLFFN